VISGSGKETAVRATQQSRATCIIKVHFSDGSHVSCTPDHLFLTKDGWVEAQYLQNNQELMV
jgi:intein/homing endonuclease